jgi:hypothetical protein
MRGPGTVSCGCSQLREALLLARVEANNQLSLRLIAALTGIL